MRKYLLSATIALFLAGAAVFVPTRLVAQPTCGCFANCLLGSCSCGGYSTVASVCNCSCTWGQPTCHCWGY